MTSNWPSCSRSGDASGGGRTIPPPGAMQGPELTTGDERSKVTTRRKDDSNDDRQTTTLPGHGDPVPRIPLPAAQNARGSAGATEAHECRGAGGVHFARLHVAASQGTAAASQSGSDGPTTRARQQIECSMNWQGADLGEILGGHWFPKLHERKFAQRQPGAARTSTVATT
jgi:hypothetical protein